MQADREANNQVKQRWRPQGKLHWQRSNKRMTTDIKLCLLPEASPAEGGKKTPPANLKEKDDQQHACKGAKALRTIALTNDHERKQTPLNRKQALTLS